MQYLIELGLQALANERNGIARLSSTLVSVKEMTLTLLAMMNLMAEFRQEDVDDLKAEIASAMANKRPA